MPAHWRKDHSLFVNVSMRSRHESEMAAKLSELPSMLQPYLPVVGAPCTGHCGSGAKTISVADISSIAPGLKL